MRSLFPADIFLAVATTKAKWRKTRLKSIRNKTTLLLFAVLAVALGQGGFAVPCEAGLMRYEFTGHMTLIRGRLPGDSDYDAGSVALDSILPFTTGSTFTGSFMYDTSATDADPADPTTGIYDGILPEGSITWNIGGSTFTGGAAEYAVRVLDRDAQDLFNVIRGGVFGPISSLNPPFLPDGWMISKPLLSGSASTYDLGVSFVDRTDKTALTSDALPNPFSFPEFDFGSVSFATGASRFYPLTVTTRLGSIELDYMLLQGAIDEVTAAPLTPVPEPSSIFILLAGGVCGVPAVLIRRRRRAYKSCCSV